MVSIPASTAKDASMLMIPRLLYKNLYASFPNTPEKAGDCALVFLNNYAFVALWKIFFLSFPKLGTWGFAEMSTLIAFSTGAYGLMLVLWGGTRQISQGILQGTLTPLLLQPGSCFVKMMLSHSIPRGWGHIATSACVFLCHSVVHPSLLPLLVICLILASLLFAAITSLLASLSFWTQSAENLAHKYYELLLFFAMYPTHVCHGAIKILLLTLCPAGIVGLIPLDLFEVFSYTEFFLFMICCLLSLYVAYGVFAMGLAHYRKNLILYTTAS